MPTAWYRVPLRCVTSIDAPAEAARRALRAPQVWTRAATATGGLFEVSSQTPELQAEQLVRFRPRAFGRPFLLRVEHDTELPVLGPVEGSLRTWIRLFPSVIPTAAGCSASVRIDWLGPTRILDPTLRPALVRYGDMLLGIATLAAREPVRVVAGAVVDGGRVLVARRRASIDSASDAITSGDAGRWELPGGKVQPAESDQEALERELLEELGLRSAVRERIGPTVTVRPGMQLFCYRVDRVGLDDLVLTDHDEVRWVDGDELAALDLLDADRALLQPLRGVLEQRF